MADESTERPVDIHGNPLKFRSKVLENAYRKLHPEADLGAFENPPTETPDDSEKVDPWEQKITTPGIATPISKGAEKIAIQQLPAIQKAPTDKK